MTDHEFSLIQQTKRREIGRSILRGMRALKNWRKAVCFAVLVAIIGLFINHLGTASLSGIIDLRPIIIPGYCIIAVGIICFILFLFGRIPHAREMQNNLERAGIINHIGEAPTVINIAYPDNRLIEITFELRGYQVSDWIDMQSKVESALNLVIFRIVDGCNMRQVVILGVRPTGSLPKKISWNAALSSPDAHTIVLGESRVGLVSIDLLKTPHWLIAATTGMGKTQLMILIVEQCLAKGMRVTIADWKGGIDYSKKIQTHCNFITDYEVLLAALDAYARKIKTRMQLYTLEMQRHESEDITCNNIEIYNKLSEIPLEHYVLLIDEASMIFDVTGRNKEERAIIAEIINRINIIGRIGRAYGIHLIIGTQRPDVASIPGSVKANLDGRICGHTADNPSSMVVLDTANAAKLPAIPGRFILRDGSGLEQVFQAYMPS